MMLTRCVFVTLATVTLSAAQSVASKVDRFDALVRTVLKDETVGVAVAVVADGERAYRPGTGWIQVDRVSNDRLLVAQPRLTYGSSPTIIRSAGGAVTHIMHGPRALRKGR